MKSLFKIVAFLLFTLILSGCAPQMPLQVQSIPVTPASNGSIGVPMPSNCAEATGDNQLVRIDSAGYCFQIPSGYEARVFEETGGVLVSAPAGSEGHRERLFVDIEPALGRSFRMKANQIYADFAASGFDLQVDDLSLGGAPAVRFSRMPGQSLNRRIVAAHEDRIVQLTFMPDEIEMGPAYEEMEALYAEVMASFVMIAPTKPIWSFFIQGEETDYPLDGLLWWERWDAAGHPDDCRRLVMSASGQSWAGSCDQAQVEGGNAPYRWTEIRDRFAPFVYLGGDARISFAGRGEIYHPAWQRAIANWAEVSHGETVNGTTGATSRTILSWWLGPVDGEEGLCRHLVVLSHGYAYANQSACGGDARNVSEGWLDTPEMAALDGWLYGFLPTYEEDNYLEGRGGEEMSQETLEELAAWAEHVYQRVQERR